MSELSLANAPLSWEQPPESALAPPLETAATQSQSYLKFTLGFQGALMPTRQVQEAITMATARVTPMPNLPPALLGLINRRSQVLWVTDLALLLGIPIAYPNNQQYNIVLMQTRGVSLGLRVHTIEGILSLPRHQVQTPPAHIPNTLVPFLQGCVLQQGEVLLVLDGEAILRSPVLQIT